ncbi:MAG: amidohydrolase, partial [Firmicutes bacterium]|nr:amidohydrolase [Bacillota bacterium]
GVFVQALWAENGIICGVGGNRDIPEEFLTGEVIDCQGRTVIPGLNDSHLHLVKIGTRMGQVKISDAVSVDDLVERVRNFMKVHPESCRYGISGGGWNQDLFTDEKRMPDRYDLDRISTQVPVVLSRICSHVVSVNSKALEMLGLDKEGRMVEGGTVECDEKGVPNGIFTETAVDLALSVIPEATREDAMRDYLTAARYALSRGITSVQSNDAGHCSYPTDMVLDVLREIYSKDLCPLRYRGQVKLDSPEELEAFAAAGGFSQFEDCNPNQFTLGSVKLFKDGSLGARTATMRRGYLDDPGNFGVESISGEDMDAYCRIADKYDLQVAAHVIGDAAVADTVSSYEKVLRHGKNPLRHTLIHCQITDLPLLERIVKAEIPVVYQPIFLDYDMHAVISRCGEELSSTSYAFKTVEDLGGCTAYSTDSPVEDCNPFPNIYSAVTRKDKNGWPEGGFFPQECVDVESAVDAYTAGSAFAEFHEHDKGRLKPGYFADLTVLDTDIFTCNPMKIRDILPVLTVVGGKVAWKKEENAAK